MMMMMMMMMINGQCTNHHIAVMARCSAVLMCLLKG